MIVTRIIVVSDSHGKTQNVKKAIEKSGPFDMLLHAGDIEDKLDDIKEWAGCPCYFVRGNCDFSRELEKVEIVPVGKHKIYLTHGHNHGVGFGTENLEYSALQNGCDVAIYGHVHIPQILRRDDITVFNPGSISLPRQTGGKKTFGIIELDDKDELHFNIVEL